MSAFCADESRRHHEQLAGSAPYADYWLILEHPGPYGRKVLQDAVWPSMWRPTITNQPAGVKVIAARRSDHKPGRLTDRHVWLVQASTGHMSATTLADTQPLDVESLHDSLAPTSSPVMFVCTHGKRDTCCARLGRAAIQEIDDENVWECSHLGGHRFAATGLLAPWGYVYGRLNGPNVLSILAAARDGQVITSGMRGRSCWTAAGQVADLAVRRIIPGLGFNDVRVRTMTEEKSMTHVVLEIIPGHRVARVTVDRRLREGQWPESCDGPDVIHEDYTVRSIHVEQMPSSG